MNLDRRLLRLARDVRAALALAVLFGVLTGALLVGQAWALSQVIHGVFLGGWALADAQPWLLALMALALARAGTIWLREVAAQRAAGHIKHALRRRLFAHLLQLGPAYTAGERSGELSNTLTEGVEALDAYFRHYLPQLAVAALVPLTMLIFILPLDPLSGLVLLLTAPLMPLFMVLIGRMADAVTRRQWGALSIMSAHFLDVLQGLTTLKLFGRSRAQIDIIAHVSDRFRETTLSVLRVAFLSALALELLATIGTAIVAVEVGLRLLYGALSFDRALFVLVLAPEFYLPLRALGIRFHAGVSGVAAAERIFAILETPLPVACEWGEPLYPGGESASSPPVPPRFHIRFENVSYIYTDAERPALKGVSFEIMPGQRVALVGPSGVGKSTVGALLLHFVEPQGGRILVDGMPLNQFDPCAWRAHVAWVPQRPYLFHGTVMDNIRMARPDASLDEVVWAARQAQAHKFIAALPRGYDTPIGALAPGGALLSGGEAQRLALARAFLKDAPFLVLDEATANLDPSHEAIIQDAIARLLHGRTALIIAHRLSTVYEADQIVVLVDGRVVQAGTHRALLEQEGVYRRMVAAYEGML